MKKILILFLFISSLLQAQYSIKGSLQPVKKYQWALLYKVEGARQVFVKNSEIKVEKSKGSFEFTLPADAKTGSYRVTYDLQNNGYVDFLFNKENVEFEFNPNNAEGTTVFKQSKENKLYKEYLSDNSAIQYKIDSLQSVYFKNRSAETAKSYKDLVQELKKTQNRYLQNAQGSLAYHFIKATNRYNSPEIVTQPQQYLDGAVTHFFDEIDFSNENLYNSSFLIDRIADYVFYMNFSQDPETQKALYKKASTIALNKVKDPNFKGDVIEFLISQFAGIKNAEIVDYLFSDHYDKLPKENQNIEFKKRIEDSMKVAIGKIAPDFSWTENGKKMSISTLTGGQSYLLIFYSTGCSHCLREVPQVFEFMKGKNNTKVIAFAMETENSTWKNYIKTLPNWHHVLGLKKWENEIARSYQITSTPTYFVLGMDKKIIANPEAIKELKVILGELN
ncbi:MAG: thioredoxin family protein [Flavobacteriaceae bacterium]